MGSKRLVWVSVGKTHHQAWLIESNDPLAAEAINEKSSDKEALIQWESVRYREWVPRSSVHFEMPTLRRRLSLPLKPPKKTEVVETEKPELALHDVIESDPCISPPRLHSIPVASADVSDDSSSMKHLENKRPRVLEFSVENLETEDDTTIFIGPKRIKSPLQNEERAASNETHGSVGMDKPEIIEGTTCEDNPKVDLGGDDYVVKNIRETKKSVSTTTAKKKFTLRDLEEDGNFTEIQRRVFNELWTGKNLFTPRSHRKQIR